MIRIIFMLALFLGSKVSWAGEKSLYDFIWLDPDKKVYVLQNKIYKKVYRPYVDFAYIDNQTSKFQDTNGIQIKGGWHFLEEWGIEAFFNKYSNKNNDDYDNVRIINDQVPFIRKLNSSYGLVAIYSPFYGKVNTFNYIFYFDWSFGVGLTKIQAESNLETANLASSQVTFDKESFTGAVLKSDVKFHVTEHWRVGLGFMNTYYKAGTPKNKSNDKIRSNTDFILNVGYAF